MKITLYGVVWKDMIEAIDSKLEEHKEGDIELYVDSPGGSVTTGTAIFNLLREKVTELHKTGNKLIAKVIGDASSIASVIICAADEVWFAETAAAWIHKPWFYLFEGVDEDDIDEYKKTLEFAKKRILRAYKTKLNLSDAELEDFLSLDRYIDAEEAKQYGLADKIWDPGEEAEEDADVKDAIQRSLELKKKIESGIDPHALFTRRIAALAPQLGKPTKTQDKNAPDRNFNQPEGGLMPNQGNAPEDFARMSKDQLVKYAEQTAAYNVDLKAQTEELRTQLADEKSARTADNQKSEAKINDLKSELDESKTSLAKAEKERDDQKEANEKLQNDLARQSEREFCVKNKIAEDEIEDTVEELMLFKSANKDLYDKKKEKIERAGKAKDQLTKPLETKSSGTKDPASKEFATLADLERAGLANDSKAINSAIEKIKQVKNLTGDDAHEQAFDIFVGEGE